ADGVLCISPRNDRSVKARVEWLRKLLGHLLARYGSPANLPRTHGLAVTGRPMLEAFPFFSGDSSSWMLQYRYNVSIAPDGRTVAQTDVLPKRILQSDSADAL